MPAAFWRPPGRLQVASLGQNGLFLLTFLVQTQARPINLAGQQARVGTPAANSRRTFAKKV
jgi:hypothetical protein